MQRKRCLITLLFAIVLVHIGCGSTGEDNGQEATGLTVGRIQALAGVRGTLYVAAYSDTVLRFNNKKRSWERTLIDWEEAHSLAVDDTTLYVGTDSVSRGTNIYRLENDGETFTKITPQGELSRGVAMAVDGNTLYASFDDGHIFRSLDSGDTWHQLTSWEGGRERGAWTLEYKSSIAVKENAIYVATPYTGVFGSVNGGLKWNALTIMEDAPLLVLDLLLSQNTLYAATTKGVYRLTVGTTSFQPAGLNDISVNSLVASPTALYAGSWENGVYRSRDGGKNWQHIGQNGIKVSTLALFENRLYVGAFSSQGLFYTDDDGASWHPLNKGLIQLLE